MNPTTKRQMTELAEGSPYRSPSPVSQDKCPEGSHWNENSKTCEKLSGTLAASSKKAFQLSLAPDKVSTNHDKMVAHDAAAEAHSNAIQLAQTLGFQDLAVQHSKAVHHQQQANVLYKELGKGRGHLPAK